MYDYTINQEDEYARITRLQNFGVECPYCHAKQGHFGTCRLFKFTDKSVPVPISEKEQKTVETYREELENAVNGPCFHPLPCVPEISDADKVRLNGLGVSWDDTANMI